MEEAERLSDRIGILKNGRLLVCDTAENIKRLGNAETFEQAFVNIVKEAQA
jgi:ABC-2 type transport system ATP-binding protein